MKKFYVRFWPYIRAYRLYFFIVFIATVIASLSTAGVAYLIKPALDGIFINKDHFMLVLVPFLLVLAHVCKGVGVLSQTYFMNLIGLSIVKNLRNNTIDKMFELELMFFNKMRSGELIARITNDINVIRVAVSQYFSQSIQEFFTALALIGVVIYQSPKLAIIGLVVMPLSVYPVRIVLRRIKTFAKSSQEKNSDITSKLTEIFNNIEVIKASNGEKIETQIFRAQNEQYFKVTLKAAFLNRVNAPMMEFLGSIAMGVVIFVGGSEVMRGAMSPGEFFSFITALFMLYSPVKKLASMASAFQEAGVASDRIFAILDEKPQIIDGARILNEPIESIEMRDVCLRYDDKLALDGVNIAAKKNDIIALIGSSGSGKTSTINLILRLFDPSSGEVLINGRPTSDFTQSSLRREIALVSQRIFIFNDSVAVNVAYGSDVDRERVEYALREAHAMEFVENLSDGIDTVLDEFGLNLSGGQRQRIAIARAIYKNPSVLILDEATSALDAQSEEEIKSAIARNCAGKIVILIAHRPSTIELANKKYEFEEGRVREI